MSKRPSPEQDEQRLIAPSPEDRSNFGAAFERLVGVMARLRGPGGCPWDRVQDLRTLRTYLLEETYELLEAMEGASSGHHCEELGDVLLQVIFQAELRREEGAFDAADVAHGISDKLVRRHPHVFGPDHEAHAEQALARWEAIKRTEREKAGRRSVLEGVPEALPALLRAERITQKAAQVGFDWTDASGPMAKLEEELLEFKAAQASLDRKRAEEELGDLLLSVVNVARFFEVSAENALRGAVLRFMGRFQFVEEGLKKRGKTLSEATMEEMETLWQEAKAQE